MRAWALALGVTALVLACGDEARDPFFVVPDAGVDAGDAATPDAAVVDPTLGGPCTDASQCDDGIACTFDTCDLALSRCRNTPDDTQCADAEYCNGREICQLRRGCVPGPVVTCSDSTACTIDRCVEAAQSCERAVRDTDSDGDADAHCSDGRDCDDTDPTVSSTRVEICRNFKDDDCDGTVDEDDCSVPAHDTCATALAVGAPGAFFLTTLAASRDYASTCGVASPLAAHDIVLAITVPAGGAKDVVVRAATASTDIAVAMRATCEDVGSERSCAVSAREARGIVRSASGGETVYAIVTTQVEAAVDVSVDFAPPTTRPTNETCGTARAVPVDEAFDVALLDPAKDLASKCPSGGELTYAFTTTSTRDVRIFANRASGTGSPVVSLRAPGCTTERTCRDGAPAFARSLAAGTHVFAVSATAQMDASVIVRTYAPTAPPPDQSCITAPEIPTNSPELLDLSGREEAIDVGCLGGAPNVAYRFTLAQPSDVLATARFDTGDSGAIALADPLCAKALACSVGSGTPTRVSRRNLPAGDYRVIVSARTSQAARVAVMVRPTLAPVTVTSDGCADAVAIPETGGFFTGDTSTRTADFTAACDSGGLAAGGAKDQLLRMTLSAPRHVVFDMSGSSYTTLLDIRGGEACPGTEIACELSTGSGRSFAELDLPAGTYWIQVDGYALASGVWNLDVRVR